ncbi:MAG: hypothetical protein Q4B42_05640 [Oscillospiraceae bacterium]|nr:hypothetical protein [Oscillospiraceae bacterium]
MKKAFDFKTSIHFWLVLVILYIFRFFTIVYSSGMAGIMWRPTICWAGFYAAGRLLLGCLQESGDELNGRETRLIWLSLAGGVLCGGLDYLLHMLEFQSGYAFALLSAASTILYALAGAAVMLPAFRDCLKPARPAGKALALCAAAALLSVVYELAAAFADSAVLDPLSSSAPAWWAFCLVFHTLAATVFFFLLLSMANLLLGERVMAVPVPHSEISESGKDRYWLARAGKGCAIMSVLYLLYIPVVLTSYGFSSLIWFWLMNWLAFYICSRACLDRLQASLEERRMAEKRLLWFSFAGGAAALGALLALSLLLHSGTEGFERAGLMSFAYFVWLWLFCAVLRPALKRVFPALRFGKLLKLKTIYITAALAALMFLLNFLGSAFKGYYFSGVQEGLRTCMLLVYLMYAAREMYEGGVNEGDEGGGE